MHLAHAGRHEQALGPSVGLAELQGRVLMVAWVILVPGLSCTKLRLDFGSLLPPQTGVIKDVSLAAFKPTHIRKVATELHWERNARRRLMLVLNPLRGSLHEVGKATCTAGMCKSVCPAAC